MEKYLNKHLKCCLLRRSLTHTRDLQYISLNDWRLLEGFTPHYIEISPFQLKPQRRLSMCYMSCDQIARYCIPHCDSAVYSDSMRVPLLGVRPGSSWF